jgi:hypothetical protein
MMPNAAFGLKSVLVSSLLAMGCSVNALEVSSSFLVTVRLQSAGICISSTLSRQTNALVRVTCQGNQFVSIEPREGRPFVGTHGGAYRFAFSQRSGWIGNFGGFGGGASELEDSIGQGTITALRMLDLRETDERLELLVSF